MARLFYAIQTRLRKTPDGAYYADAEYVRYERWQDHLEAFDEVHLICRVGESTDTRGHRVDGPGLYVHQVPTYRSWTTLVIRLPIIVGQIVGLRLERSDAIGGRLFDLLSTLLFLKARIGRRHPFLAEIVGDPVETARVGALGHVGKLLLPFIRLMMRRIVKSADATIYVTESVLQTLYPPALQQPTIAFSTVELPIQPGRFVARDYRTTPIVEPLRLLTVGSQERRYKGHDLLIRATKELIDRGFPTVTIIVGGGRYHEELRQLASELSVEEYVTLTGHVSDRPTIDQHFRRSDLFVLPSRTEGLCRALIEAMSWGLPVVASKVGGNPELVDSSALFTSESIEELVEIVIELSGDATRLSMLSERSVSLSRNFAQAEGFEHFTRRKELLRNFASMGAQ